MAKRRNAVITILACYLLDSDDDEDDDYGEQRESKKRRVWRKDWVGLRESDGFCAKLMLELRAGEPELYRNFVRMAPEQFDHLLALVKPHIEKSDTNMRSSIPAAHRLVLTLRYLATGDSFRSLQYIFRIPQTTISRIIPEVLDAIYRVLVDDFLKVCLRRIYNFFILIFNFIFVAS